MGSSFDANAGADIVRELVAVIVDNREYLSEVDGAIGDGDHGINMAKGFRLCGEAMEGRQLHLGDALGSLATTLMGSIGGSMGPLYGSLFMGMADGVSGRERIDAEAFGAMLGGGLDSLGAVTSAGVGDKCLMDTLVPAVTAYREAVANGAGFAAALQVLRESAEAGKESTRDLVARIGRAARLGERSRGALDAGATSCWLVLTTLADSAEKRLE